MDFYETRADFSKLTDRIDVQPVGGEGWAAGEVGVAVTARAVFDGSAGRRRPLAHRGVPPRGLRSGGRA